MTVGVAIVALVVAACAAPSPHPASADAMTGASASVFSGDDVAWHAPPAETGPDGYTTRVVDVSGRLVDSAGTPLEGGRAIFVPFGEDRVVLGLGPPAYVHLFASEQGEQLARLPRASTGPDGRFELTCPVVVGDGNPSGSLSPVRPRDTIRLVLVAPGHAAWTVSFGETGDAHDVGTIALRPGGSIIGRVVDDDGAPVGGARLWHQRVGRPALDDPDEAEGLGNWTTGGLAVETGADGRFVLGPMWPGTARVHVFHRDRWGQLLDDVRVDAAAGPTDLGDVTLSLGDALEGVVRDTGGAPVPGALVTIIPQHEAVRMSFVGIEAGGLEPEPHAIPRQRALAASWTPITADAQGRFRQTGCWSEGRFLIFAEAPGVGAKMLFDVPGDAPVEVVLEVE